MRAVCKGVSRAFTCLLLVLCLKLFPQLESNLGLQACFYLFSIIMALSIPLVYLILPETKDMGLEMIQNYFLPPTTVFYVDLDCEAGGRPSDKKRRNSAVVLLDAGRRRDSQVEMLNEGDEPSQGL